LSNAIRESRQRGAYHLSNKTLENRVSTGKVKVVNHDRGFCFITLEQEHVSGKRDVFAHYSSFEAANLPRPEVGNRYEFEIRASDKGINATNLTAL
jgi:cold shock CspA family protein